MTEQGRHPACTGCRAQVGEFHDPECPAVDAFTTSRIQATAGAELKGGPQSRRAALLGTNPRFRLYLDDRRRRAYGLSSAQLPDGTHSETDAADFIRQACGVKSRAESDHNDTARAMLDRIVADYQRWERQQRSAR